ncbi:MAG: arginine repressor [Oscillospiraceae bacterium]
MKAARHSAILRIIETAEIDTQEALLERLSALGFDVTQATVSRDIKELSLTKIITGDGKYKYARPKGIPARTFSADPLGSVFAQEVRAVDFALNMVSVRCAIGMAQAVCAKLDAAQFYGVVGTIAGDDTIFILMKTEEDALSLVSKLKNLIEKSGEEDA